MRQMNLPLVGRIEGKSAAIGAAFLFAAFFVPVVGPFLKKVVTDVTVKLNDMTLRPGV